MKTIVYVDGFNLYYGAVKDNPYKWLNVHRMCELLLPQNKIVGIKYFTAKIYPRPDDPQKHIRQLVYLRALETLPNFEIIYGHYLSHVVSMPLANPPTKGSKFAQVIKTEEKGSDVNLAVHMLNDGYQRIYELAVIVSNDSDLLSAIQIVQNDLNLNVGILNPQKHPSKVLKNEALFLKKIRPGVLRASQFPKTMKDAKGSFYKPKGW
jgi:uncharacterized LabA/DUF88 family protein